MKSYGRTTPVDQYDLDMTFIRTHDSIKVAAKFFGVSVQMISMNCRGVKKAAHGFIWRYNRSLDFEDEFWLNYPLDERFMVSNRGRVRLPTGKITIGYNVAGYRRIRTSNVSTSIHRMVALTFIEPVQGANLVNHIDHNPQNNFLENLEWVSHRGNMLAAEAFYKDKKKLT
jgi:hypothetical protein